MGSLFSSPSENVQAPTLQPVYQPTGSSTADTGALGGIGNLGNYNTFAQFFPQATNIAESTINNPFSGAYMGGAQTAGGLGQTGALGAFGYGSNLYCLGNQVAQTAFDPQSALYGKTAQQVQDQTRAANEAAGVGTTPYGAGIEANTMSNFNINWQAQQLANQLQGANAAANLGTTGNALQSGAANNYLAASGMPYGVYSGMGQSNLGLLGNMATFGSQGAQIPQMQVQDYLNYLGYGTQAAGVQNQGQLGLYADQLKQAQQQAQEQQAMWSGIGKVGGAILGTAIGGPGGATIGQSIAGSMFGG